MASGVAQRAGERCILLARGRADLDQGVVGDRRHWPQLKSQLAERADWKIDVQQGGSIRC
jgi:hypothetical protein